METYTIDEIIKDIQEFEGASVSFGNDSVFKKWFFQKLYSSVENS